MRTSPPLAEVVAIKILSVQIGPGRGLQQISAGVGFWLRAAMPPTRTAKVQGRPKLVPECRPGQDAGRTDHSSPSARKLSSRALPMMRWSCTVIPMTSAAATMRFVMVMSACEGVGSPDGWLCTIHMVRITC